MRGTTVEIKCKLLNCAFFSLNMRYVLQWCNRDPRCKKLQLTDLLVAPVQHIMKVPLILKEVETRTEDSAEREQITQILEVEENSISEYPACFDMLAVLFQGILFFQDVMLGGDLCFSEMPAVSWSIWLAVWTDSWGRQLSLCSVQTTSYI